MAKKNSSGNSDFNGPGTWVGGKALTCDCGNSTNWQSLSMSGGKTTATCGNCKKSVSS